MKLTVMGKYSHTSLPTSLPFCASLALLIGEQRQQPAPIRRVSTKERSEGSPCWIQRNAQPADDPHSSHGQETTEVSHTPRWISSGLTGKVPVSPGGGDRSRPRWKQGLQLRRRESDRSKSQRLERRSRGTNVVSRLRKYPPLKTDLWRSESKPA